MTASTRQPSGASNPTRREQLPAIVLVRLTASTPAIVNEFEGRYHIFSARHVQAACRFFLRTEPAFVIASKGLPFYDLDALSANIPANALFRLASPTLGPKDLSLLIRSAHRVLAFAPPRAS